MQPMATDNSSVIPVRIPREFLSRIDAAAERLGTNRSALMVFCIKSFVADFEEKGFAILPLNWEEILKSQDGRTAESRSVAQTGYGANPPQRLALKEKAEKLTVPANAVNCQLEGASTGDASKSGISELVEASLRHLKRRAKGGRSK